MVSYSHVLELISQTNKCGNENTNLSHKVSPFYSNFLHKITQNCPFGRNICFYNFFTSHVISQCHETDRLHVWKRNFFTTFHFVVVYSFAKPLRMLIVSSYVISSILMYFHQTRDFVKSYSVKNDPSWSQLHSIYIWHI